MAYYIIYGVIGGIALIGLTAAAVQKLSEKPEATTEETEEPQQEAREDTGQEPPTARPGEETGAVVPEPVSPEPSLAESAVSEVPESEEARRAGAGDGRLKRAAKTAKRWFSGVYSGYFVPFTSRLASLVGLERRAEAACLKGSETTWADCQVGILQQVAAFTSDREPIAQLADRLNRFGSTEIVEIRAGEDLFSSARSRGFNTLLQIEIPAMRLALNQDCTSCLQLAIVTRLWDVNTATLLYEKTELHHCAATELPDLILSPFPRAPLPFSAYDEAAVFIDEPSQTLGAVTYCGEGGIPIVKQDLNSALSNAVRIAIDDFGLDGRQAD